VIITKSYGVFTSIAAIFLFGSTITWLKFAAILFVLFCTAIVTGVFEKGKNKTESDYSWVTLSFISFFCFGFLRLSGKWLVGIEHVPQFTYQSWLLTIVAILSVFDLLIHRKKAYTPLNIGNVLVLIGTGVFVSGFYGFLLTAELSAPNLGYVGAINTSSNAIFTVLAAKFLGDKISLHRYLGVLGVTAGIILLVI
jgi:drug/metabolite transporter (DMT)-like permease